MTTSEIDQLDSAGAASAGLPDAPENADETLRDAGIDPDRLSISYLGEPVSEARGPNDAISLGLAVEPPRGGGSAESYLLLHNLR